MKLEEKYNYIYTTPLMSMPHDAVAEGDPGSYWFRCYVKGSVQWIQISSPDPHAETCSTSDQ